MSSDFNVTVASWFLRNVHLKAISTHSAPPPPKIRQHLCTFLSRILKSNYEMLKLALRLILFSVHPHFCIAIMQVLLHHRQLQHMNDFSMKVVTKKQLSGANAKFLTTDALSERILTNWALQMETRQLHYPTSHETSAKHIEQYVDCVIRVNKLYTLKISF